MQNENLARQIMEVYLEGARASLGLVAAREAETEENCRKEWDALARAGAVLRDSPVPEPSRMVINRILAFARGEDSMALPAARLGFLSLWFKPAAVLAGFMILVTAGILMFRISGANDIPRVASLSTESVTGAAADTTPVAEWVMNTSVLSGFSDIHGLEAPLLHQFSTPRSKNDRYRLLGPASLLTPVSLGELDPTLAIDDELDRKILADSALTDKELEILFFRARKLERLGYYREALKDYEFINRFNSASVNLKSVHLAMAVCLEKLERKEDAIMLLKSFETAHGASREIDLRIDELKSVSF